MNIRKKLAIIAAVAALALYGGGIALAVANLNIKPDTPAPSVVSVFGEPNYQVLIDWEPVRGAYAYELQYEYAYEQGKKVIITTRDTSRRIERIKGELRYRMRTLSRNGEGKSDYTEWQTFTVPPLYIDVTPEQWEITKVEDGYKVSPQSWTALHYKFKSRNITVSFFDFVVVGPGHDKDAEFLLNMQTMDTTLQHIFPFNPGVWTVYYRPSICMFVLNNKKEYNDEIIKIYDETDNWRFATVTVE